LFFSLASWSQSYDRELGTTPRVAYQVRLEIKNISSTLKNAQAYYNADVESCRIGSFSYIFAKIEHLFFGHLASAEQLF
jgi:hypothetical protein